MSAPVFVTGNYSDLYGSSMLPALEELFMSRLNRHPNRREQLFNMKKAQNGIYQYSELHDMPLHTQMSEGQEYTYQRPRQGANKTLAVVKFGLGASISDEAIRDAKFDVVADIVRKMADSAAESREIAAMNIFNNAFSSETTADGAAVISTSHTLPSGLTWRNRLSTDSDLSQSSLQQAITDFETTPIGDTGIKKRIMPKILLVPSVLRPYAMELVGSDLKPDTMDNNLNFMKSEGITVVSSPHLTDEDAWFLLSAKEDNSLTIVEDYGVQTKGWEDNARDSVKYRSRYREKVGVFNGYGLFGTSGAT